MQVEQITNFSLSNEDYKITLNSTELTFKTCISTHYSNICAILQITRDETQSVIIKPSITHEKLSMIYLKAPRQSKLHAKTHLLTRNATNVLQRIFSISPRASSHCSNPFRPNSTIALANPAIIFLKSASFTRWYLSNSLLICSEATLTSDSSTCNDDSNYH